MNTKTSLSHTLAALLIGAMPFIAMRGVSAAGEIAQDITVQVTINGTVTGGLLAAVHAVPASDVRAFPEDDTIYARMPVAQVPALAKRPEVKFIDVGPAVRAQGEVAANAALQASIKKMLLILLLDY